MKRLKVLSNLLKAAGLKMEAAAILKISSNEEYLYHETSREALEYIEREGLLPTSYGQSLVGDDGQVMSPEEKIESIEWRLEEEGLSEEEIEEIIPQVFKREVPEEDLVPRTYVHFLEPSSYSYGEVLLRFPIRKTEMDVDPYILERVGPEELEKKIGDLWYPLLSEDKKESNEPSFKIEASDSDSDNQIAEEDVSSQEELLEILLNDDLYLLSKEEQKNFENWDWLTNFLESLGSNLTKIFKPNGEETTFFKVEIPKKGIYIVDSEYPEFKNSDLRSWVQGIIDSGGAEEWSPEIEADIPSIVYHGTPDENVEDILRDGFQCRSDSRGISNRGVGCAVFTTSEESEAEEYGRVFKIDVGAMERDGVLPRVSQEPDIEYYNACNSFASSFGLYLGDSVFYDIEYGMSPNTFILNGPVAPKYISLISE
jgi:hypothetical protein